MKLLLPSQATSILRISALRSLFYSSRTGPATTSSYSNDDLPRRIARAGNPAASVIPVLDQWLDQGKQVKPSELQSIVKMLRRYKRFNHALQIFDWMNEQKGCNLRAGDHAVKLELISRVHGIKAAEIYFESIPMELRDYHVYGSLLFCYTSKKLVQKAEAIMQKMRDQGLMDGALCYNVMLKLYSTLGEYDKVSNLFQEMEEKHVQPNKFTLNTRLHAFAELSDVDGMKSFLAKWEADPKVAMDWHTYVTAANGFVKAGQKETALTFLRKSEQLIEPKSKKFAYEVLITSYGNAGRKEDVYRLWKLYKMMMTTFYNSSYICVISSLLKLDDIEGAEKILEEWETGHVMFDLRVPNLLVSGYCKKGMMEKAEDFVNRLINKGTVLDTSTWERLALGYQTANQMEKAMERWKKAILASEPGQKLQHWVLVACVDYLEGKGDVENVKGVLRLLHQHGHLSKEKHDRLLGNVGGGNLGLQIAEAVRADRHGGTSSNDTDNVKGEDEMDLEFAGNN